MTRSAAVYIIRTQYGKQLVEAYKCLKEKICPKVSPHDACQLSMLFEIYCRVPLDEVAKRGIQHNDGSLLYRHEYKSLQFFRTISKLSDLPVGNQDKQMQFQPSQPDIRYRDLTTANNPLAIHSYSPTFSEHVQPINHAGQQYVNMQNSFSGQLSAFNYSGAKHQLMAYPTSAIFRPNPFPPYTPSDLDGPQHDLAMQGLPFFYI
jgi:hypothetical protein